MITINEEHLKLEIEHIFDSGANEMRVLEMVKNYIHTRNQVSENESIGHVSGISTDLEKDLFVLINKYAKAGLSKPHTVARLEWVLGSVKKS